MVYGFDREHIYVWRFCTSLTLFLPVNLTPACNEPWHAHVIALLPRNIYPLEVRSAYKPIHKESELIMIVKSMIDKGLDVKQFSPEEIFEIGTGPMHLLSMKTEEIINNDESRSSFAYFVCAMETIQQAGVHISRRITSRNNELFITYEYPESEYIYFHKLHEHWKDMLYIYERKDSWTEQELASLEKQFKTDITGENDVLFSEV